MYRIKVEPRYYQAQGPLLSTRVSFVRIDPADWKLPQDNHTVSDLLSQVSKRRVEIERLLTTFVTQRNLFLFYRRSA